MGRKILQKLFGKKRCGKTILKHAFFPFHFLFVWICSHSFLSQGNQPNAKLCSRCQFRQNAKLCSQYGMQMPKLCWRCKLWHCPLHCTTNQACSARHVTAKCQATFTMASKCPNCVGDVNYCTAHSTVPPWLKQCAAVHHTPHAIAAR